MNENQRWLWVAGFAGAMAWVEAAVVVYLRTMIDRIQPYQPNPLPISAGFGQVELVREAATLVMLVAAGWLAGRTRRGRLAYAVIAFGIWDILYYVFLKVITGWPASLLDWDVLFLLPLPWWGPVLAPVSIAALLILGGTLVSRFEAAQRPLWPGRTAWVLSLAGAALALYVFMADAIQAVPGGTQAIRLVLPAAFNWPVFLAAFGLMAVPVAEMGAQWEARRRGIAVPSGEPGAAIMRNP
jgi:hypothetical protein